MAPAARGDRPLHAAPGHLRRYVHTLDGACFVALMRSYSRVANLLEDARAELLGRVRGMAEATPALRLGYRTEIRFARRA